MNIRRLAVLAALAAAVLLLTPPRAGAQPPKVTQKVLRAGNKTYSFTFRYPELSVPGALMGVRGIMGDYNRAFRAIAERYLTNFKKDLADLGPPPAELKSAKSEVDGRYNVLVNRQGVFSVKWDVYHCFAGAAHPDTVVITSNWIGDRPIHITDLFSDPKRGLQAVSEAARADLAKQFAKEQGMLSLEDGAGPDPKNYEAFGLRKQGLQIFFQRGQVAAGAAGNLTVLIAWNALKAQLKPEMWAAIEKI